MLEQPNQTNIGNIETARLERLRSQVEGEVSAYVKSFDMSLSVRVRNENNQLFVTLLKDGEWVFDAYIVANPLSIKPEAYEKSVEEHIINSARSAVKSWIDNPIENRQFSKQKRAA